MTTTNQKNNNPPLTESELAKLLADYLSDDCFELAWTNHAAERGEERGIFAPAIMRLLRKRPTYETVEPAARGLYKYTVFGYGPASSSRQIGVVIIPSMEKKAVKIVTVMRKDESGK